MMLLWGNYIHRQSVLTYRKIKVFYDAAVILEYGSNNCITARTTHRILTHLSTWKRSIKIKQLSLVVQQLRQASQPGTQYGLIRRVAWLVRPTRHTDRQFSQNMCVWMLVFINVRHKGDTTCDSNTSREFKVKCRGSIWPRETCPQWAT